MLNKLEKDFTSVAAENGVTLHIDLPKDIAANIDHSSDELHTLLYSVISLGLKCARPGSDVYLRFHTKVSVLDIELSLHSTVEIDFLKSLLESRLELVNMEHIPLYIQVSRNITSLHLQWEKITG